LDAGRRSHRRAHPRWLRRSSLEAGLIGRSLLMRQGNTLSLADAGALGVVPFQAKPVGAQSR
jgi:hypothetical protein